MDNAATDPDRDAGARQDGLLTMAVVGALTAAVVIAADPWSLGDGLSRDLATGAVAGAFALLGVAAAVSLFAMIAPRRLLRLTVVLSVLAVLGLAGAVTAVGVAVVRVPRGEPAEAAVAPELAPEATVEPGALPFERATAVFLDLTADARTRLAGEMGCTRRDLLPGPVAAVAIGGTYASPIVNVRIVNGFGELSSACDAVRMRIPAADVVVIPAALD